jgi:hypothetical protein
MLATAGTKLTAGTQATAITQATEVTPRAAEMSELVLKPNILWIFAEIHEKIKWWKIRKNT